MSSREYILKYYKSKTMKQWLVNVTKPNFIRDDEEGHLIYVNGDILQARCIICFFSIKN